MRRCYLTCFAGARQWIFISLNLAAVKGTVKTQRRMQNTFKGRILPGWVFSRTFFDHERQRRVSYHELCPTTPLLFFNHYWDGLRDREDWPATKPLYLMPNIEMYELQATHYREADVILCKTAICTTYLTKWFKQEGNPRMTKVLYTRFTSSDVATNALVLAGIEEANSTWHEYAKQFETAQFTHAAGTSSWKGTRQVLDCWTSRPDFPRLDLYIHEHTYKYFHEATYGEKIRRSHNIHLHMGKVDSISYGKMIANTSFFLCPSEMEGYGHYINNARASGGLIVTSDAPPMNELVTRSSGVLVDSTLGSQKEIFLGGMSPLPHALRNVPGYMALLNGPAVCQAVEFVLHDLDLDARKQRARRGRQQFFYDTAFFAAKMQRLREAILPNAASEA